MNSAAMAAPQVGQAAPVLVVKELNGTVFNLAKSRGQVVVINVWATWCVPCRAEMPMLNDFYKHFHPQGLELLGLSVDSTHDDNAVRKVMKEFRYPAAMLKHASQNGFGPPRIVPMTYVIDKNGVLRAELWAGGMPSTRLNLETVVKPLLASSDKQ
ncbi:MAG: TlpA disulfide reductase family protein [Gammaproteobacteria bacterium]